MKQNFHILSEHILDNWNITLGQVLDLYDVVKSEDNVLSRAEDNTAWLAQDLDGRVYVYSKRPKKNVSNFGRCWYCRLGIGTAAAIVATLPANDQWEETLVEVKVVRNKVDGSVSHLLFQKPTPETPSAEEFRMAEPVDNSMGHPEDKAVDECGQMPDIERELLRLQTAEEVLDEAKKSLVGARHEIPFGMWAGISKAALFLSWLDGKKIEYKHTNSSAWKEFLPIETPSWSSECHYAVVEEWGQPEFPFDWNHIKSEYKYVAIDPRGAAYAYIERPSVHKESWRSGGKLAALGAMSMTAREYSKEEISEHWATMVWKRP